MIGWMSAVVFAVSAQTYSHGTPTNDEQQILEMINRARRDPWAEGLRLGIDITEGLTPTEAGWVRRRPPLALHPQLSAAAAGHAQHMWDNDYFSHTYPVGSPSPTSTPESRIRAAGYDPGTFDSYAMGENIVHGSDHTPVQLQNALMVDADVAGRGHRKALLDIVAPASYRPYREVGLAYRDMGSSRTGIFRHIVVQNFGKWEDTPSPYLVGVVYDDDGDGTYEAGEGMGGVALALSAGTWDATTSSSGGYAVPISGSTGALDVTASGGGLAAPVTKSFYRTGENVKVDVRAADAVDTDGDGLPNHWEATYPASATPTSDADGDGSTALEEFRFGSRPDDPDSTPLNPDGTAAVPPPPPGDDDGSSGGGCGALGGEAVLALLLLRRRRSS